MNRQIVEAFSVSQQAIDTVVERESRELERRERIYREGRPPPGIRDRIVILVDDGIATGSTVRAAIEVLRRLRAGRIVVATPVIAASTYRDMAHEVDEIVAVLRPEEFYGVGQWYENFSPTTDEQVQELLGTASLP